MRVIGYCRVSTSEQGQSGLGLEAQEEAIQAEVERRGWTITRLVTEVGSAGSVKKRPLLQKVLADLQEDQADCLIVAKLDRLSRRVLDFARLVDQIANMNRQLVILDASGVDSTSPAGELHLNMLSAFSQFERRLIGQRTKDALAVKRAQGTKLGRPDTLDPAIRQRVIHERVSLKRPLQAIADDLNRQGVPTARGGRWHAPTICNIVKVHGRDVPITVVDLRRKSTRIAWSDRLGGSSAAGGPRGLLAQVQV